MQHVFQNEQFNSEILDVPNVLVYVSCSHDTPIQVLNKITSKIKKHVQSEVQIKVGCGMCDEEDFIQLYIVGSN
ncbi:hypothetical protein [Sinanaerobacter sp. ZZT-01]|uniref:hypothetical protein n=1 Tax=Sinanaerobacter sp. ZZT-01 TaxID=3111540 RepID=UPI002D7945B7|nr:hypothetical protein [Sinanaerobacter sp. ZZT-01]WRR93191.1 hypothetical protein U5921_14315 [Sinanaerobacter sp. ZZT-01]